MDDETKRRAFALRQQGMSWRAIADKLHYDYAHLSREVVKAAKGGKKSHAAKTTVGLARTVE